MRVRVGQPYRDQCPAAFPQLRWAGYVAYHLEQTDSVAADAGGVPTVGLVVVSETPWVRGSDGVLRSDVDGDGKLEEVRRCAAGEGEHFTLWTVEPEGGRVRRWHEYYDWGGMTDPTCGPGEDGREPSTVGRT